MEDSSLCEELLLPPDADGKEAITGVAAVSVHPVPLDNSQFQASGPPGISWHILACRTGAVGSNCLAVKDEPPRPECLQATPRRSVGPGTYKNGCSGCDLRPGDGTKPEAFGHSVPGPCAPGMCCFVLFRGCSILKPGRLLDMLDASKLLVPGARCKRRHGGVCSAHHCLAVTLNVF